MKKQKALPLDGGNAWNEFTDSLHKSGKSSLAQSCVPFKGFPQEENHYGRTTSTTAY
jgi:hypothetical protein